VHTDIAWTSDTAPLSEVVGALKQVAQQMSTQSNARPSRTHISGPGDLHGESPAEAHVTVLHFMLGRGENVPEGIERAVGSILSGRE
jgi:hypothetical protein